MGQALLRNQAWPKNSCLRKLPMYCPILNLMRHVIWKSVIVGLCRKFVESEGLMSAHYGSICL